MQKLILILPFILIACSSPIEEALSSDHIAIRTVMDSLQKHEVQIIYTQIDTSDAGTVTFKDYTFQVRDKHYFYPASSVKLPIAILATEYIQQYPELHLDTPYVSKRDTIVHSIADDIRQIFAVSDNEAYNRLYELMGRDYINTQLTKKGLSPSRIAHRLSTSDAANPNRTITKFFPSYEGEVIEIKGPPDSPIQKIKLKNQIKGNGFIKDGTLVATPFDFSEKNYYPLETQHNLMKRLFFEDLFSEKERFQLSPKDKARIQKSMATLPRDATYDPENYYDSYVKFFLYGDSKEIIPDHIRIYNKVGYAYGTLTETAYIVDKKEQISFLLSATILVNNNGVFNDDTYEYDDIGIPFLAQLGREIYAIEKNRK